VLIPGVVLSAVAFFNWYCEDWFGGGGVLPNSYIVVAIY
jgi:hypothetical protein